MVLLVLCACAGHAERVTSVRQLRLADSAIITIPDAATDGQYAMSTIRGTTRLRDGGFAVWAGPELFLFDSAGSFLRKVGGRGQGPGEFLSILGAEECDPGRLAVWDGFARRLTILNLADTSTQVWNNQGVPQFSRFAGCASGDAVVTASDFAIGSTTVTQDTVHVIRIAIATGAARPLTSAEGLLHVGPLQRFSRFTVTASRDSVIVIGDNGTGRLVRWRPGGSDTIVARLPHPPASRHLDDSVRTWWELHSGINGEPPLPEIRQMVEEAWAKLPEPDSLPLFSGMLLDDHHGVWLSAYAGYPAVTDVHPAHWTMVDDRGIPVATLALPPGFVLSGINGQHALGVQENDDGSLAVQVREIEPAQ
jgi:hypothetical protein